MLRRRIPLTARLPGGRPRYSPAPPQNLTPARDVARAAHLVDPVVSRMPAEWVRRDGIWGQPRARPPREPPLRLAFFRRLSYWCDIRWAWIWAMKSITTTTTISSEVPPK